MNNFTFKVVLSCLFIMMPVSMHAQRLTLEDLATNSLENHPVTDVAWHPDGTHIICGMGTRLGQDATLVVYSVSSDNTLTEVTRIKIIDPGAGTAEFVRGLSWHPDGVHVAVGGKYNSPIPSFVTIYTFINNQLTQTDYKTIVGPASEALAGFGGLEWHPNGNYLAYSGVSSARDGVIGIFKFNSGTLSQTENLYVEINGIRMAQTRDLSWHPDGTHIACVGADTVLGSEKGFLAVYKFNNTNGTLPTQTFTKFPISNGITAQNARGVSWNPDGNTLATGGQTDANPSEPFILLYNEFNPTTGTFNPTPSDSVVIKNPSDPNTTLHSITQIKWHPCGVYLACSLWQGAQTSFITGYIAVYGFDKKKLSLIPALIEADAKNFKATMIWSVAWNLCGNLLAATGQNGVSFFAGGDGFAALYSWTTQINSCKKFYRSPIQGDLINVINWNPIENATTYKIYIHTNLTELVGIVTQSDQPCFYHHCRKPGSGTRYYIAAYDANGTLLNLSDIYVT